MSRGSADDPPLPVDGSEVRGQVTERSSRSGGAARGQQLVSILQLELKCDTASTNGSECLHSLL